MSEEKKTDEGFTVAGKQVPAEPTTEDIIDSIVKHPDETLGAQVFAKALEMVKTDRGKEIVEAVKRLISELENAEIWAKRNLECAAIIRNKIAAVQQGRFQLVRGPGSVTIVYDQPSLNKPYPYEMGFNPYNR